MICCYHTKAKGQMCKEIIPIFLCVALLLSFTLPEIGDYTIRELIYAVQDTTTVVRGTRIACEIIAVSNPGYVVYTIYDVIKYNQTLIDNEYERSNMASRKELSVFSNINLNHTT